MLFSQKILKAINEGVLQALSFDKDELEPSEEFDMQLGSNKKLMSNSSAEIQKNYYSKKLRELFDNNSNITKDDIEQAIELHKKYGVTYNPHLDGGAFKDFINICSLSHTLDFNWVDTSEVTNMAQLFSNNYSYEIIIDEWDVSNVEDMSHMFERCYYLKNIDLSKWNVKNLKDAAYMFQYCTSLENIKLPYNTNNLENLAGMFLNCAELKVINNTNRLHLESVKTISQMFYNCTKLCIIEVSMWNTSSIEVMSYAFAGCTSLIKVNLSNWDTRNVNSMRNMFYNCENLYDVGDISKWNISNVEDFYNIFKQCGLSREYINKIINAWKKINPFANNII